MSCSPMLAVIPARGGSKGLPHKNLREFAGVPLIVHSIRLAKMCPQITRTIVSTDDEAIAKVAIQHGAEVPFLRPPELAQDDTPMLPVLQHALRGCEGRSGQVYKSLLLLDPTSPGRLPEDVKGACELLQSDPKAIGVIGVSEPHFNPRWVCVEENEGYARMAFPGDKLYTRRQDVPPVYRINGTLYLWKREYILSADKLAFGNGSHKLWKIPEERAIHIDELRDFQMGELAVKSGLVKFPWLSGNDN